MATIKERIASALSSDDTKQQGRDYLQTIRENLRLSNTTFASRATLLLIAAVSFALLADAAVGEVTLFGVKVNNLAIVQKLIPIVVAYTYYSLFAIMAYRRLLNEVHDEIMRISFPEFYAQNLEFYCYPPSPFHIERIISSETTGRLSSALNTLNDPLVFAIGVGPALFEVYAFITCFRTFGGLDVVVWISLVASTSFIIQAFLLVVGINRLVPS